MPRFAANIDWLFTEVPFLQRFAHAAQAGFGAVECMFPYAWPAQELAAQARAAGVQVVLHNLPAGDWAAGERGLACDPARVAQFRASVQQARDYALALGTAQLHCMAGLAPAGVPRASAHATLVDNLRYACRVLGDAGLRVLIEPINRFDMPGYYLERLEQALALREEVGEKNLAIQLDLYHAQRTEGELAATLAQHLAQIGHIQIADNPGRHEPGSGEINYAYLFQHLDRLGYSGWVGCEYRPASTTQAGLGWLHALTDGDARATLLGLT